MKDNLFLFLKVMQNPLQAQIKKPVLLLVLLLVLLAVVMQIKQAV
jgi:hypothetical protein